MSIKKKRRYSYKNLVWISIIDVERYWLYTYGLTLVNKRYPIQIIL